eukprot:CAMPEP_0195523396 /NCGR_PEP_ID=MMETSP0794_2-20130614/22525_1 /TAXON_ID=515487 /ORGANISM="Stephanopyxis turris, Strain CCMP 815" /LENGTH=551 /DNA_ID=CAMNT_0040653389 /DNA_START=176 /DNA_END=1831 /DNA_ORIENTATION=+
MYFYFLAMLGESVARLGNERILNLFGGNKDCVTVKGQLFIDSNENGKVDHGSDETLSNIEIGLSACGDIASQKMNSDSNGEFTFSAPNEGCYQISVIVDPALELECPTPIEIDAKCGETVTYNPFCIPKPPNSQNQVIKGQVSTDMDDPLTSGGVVTLTPCNGGSSLTVNLAGDGSFEKSSLPEGCYTIAVNPASNQLDCGGGIDITGENGSITTAHFKCVLVTTPTPSAAVGSINGGAFIDSNNNDRFDNGEGISGGFVIASPCDGSSPAVTEELATDGKFSIAVPKGCYNLLYTTEDNSLACPSQNRIDVGSGSVTKAEFECVRPPSIPPSSDNAMITGQVFLDINGNGKLDTGLDTAFSTGLVAMKPCDGNDSADITVDVDTNGKFERSVAPGCYTVMVQSSVLKCNEPSIIVKTGTTAKADLLCGFSHFTSAPAPTPSTGTINGTIRVDSNGNCALDPNSDEGLSTGTATVSACDGSSSVTLNIVDGIFTSGPLLQGCYDIAVDPKIVDLTCGSTTNIDLEGGKFFTWRTICQTQAQIISCSGESSP